MTQRWRRRRSWLWLLIAIVFLFYIQILPVGQTLNLALAPLLEASQAPGDWWGKFQLWLDDRETLQNENARFRRKLQSHAPDLQSINSLREENRQLRSLLHLQPLADFKWQAARVLARSVDRMSRHLIIKTGNARPNDVVASSEGLVGVVDSVKPEYAVVRTIFDASLSVPVTIQGSALAALMQGQGDSLKIEFLPMEAVPRTGTVFITSGAGGLFPAGIPVARITRITPLEGGIFAEVQAEALAHWRRDAWLAVAVSQQKP